ncbi:hypothetical protein FS842_006220, partial [Serendipita sp. 407]
MFGSRLFTFFTVALAGSTVVSALASGPIEVRSPGSGAVEALAVKRQESVEDQALAVIQTLTTTTAPTLANIQAVIDSGVVTHEKIDPLFAELTSALDTAADSLSKIDPSGVVVRSLLERQDSPVATALATFIQNLATTLDGLLDFLETLPLLNVLLAGLDASLNQ